MPWRKASSSCSPSSIARDPVLLFGARICMLRKDGAAIEGLVQALLIGLPYPVTPTHVRSLIVFDHLVPRLHRPARRHPSNLDQQYPLHLSPQPRVSGLLLLLLKHRFGAKTHAPGPRLGSFSFLDLSPTIATASLRTSHNPMVHGQPPSSFDLQGLRFSNPTFLTTTGFSLLCTLWWRQLSPKAVRPKRV